MEYLLKYKSAQKLSRFFSLPFSHFQETLDKRGNMDRHRVLLIFSEGPSYDTLSV